MKGHPGDGKYKGRSGQQCAPREEGRLEIRTENNGSWESRMEAENSQSPVLCEQLRKGLGISACAPQTPGKMPFLAKSYVCPFPSVEGR